MEVLTLTEENILLNVFPIAFDINAFSLKLVALIENILLFSLKLSLCPEYIPHAFSIAVFKN